MCVCCGVFAGRGLPAAQPKRCCAAQGAPETILTFVFYNTTNKVEIMNGAKANLQMMPPVRYRVYTKRLVPTFSEDRTTASWVAHGVSLR
jgi:hypothetical protein